MSDYPDYYPDDLNDVEHGHFNDTPHATIDVGKTASSVVADALKYQVHAPIAWLHEGGMVFVWGEELNRTVLSRIADACEDAEREYANSGEYDMAEWAQQASTGVIDTEIYPAGERVIT